MIQRTIANFMLTTYSDIRNAPTIFKQTHRMKGAGEPTEKHMRPQSEQDS